MEGSQLGLDRRGVFWSEGSIEAVTRGRGMAARNTATNENHPKSLHAAEYCKGQQQSKRAFRISRACTANPAPYLHKMASSTDAQMHSHCIRSHTISASPKTVSARRMQTITNYQHLAQGGLRILLGAQRVQLLLLELGLRAEACALLLAHVKGLL